MRLKHMSVLVVMALLSGVALADQPIIIDGNGNLKIVEPSPKNAGGSPPNLNQIPVKGQSGPAPAQPAPQVMAPSETPQDVQQTAPTPPPSPPTTTEGEQPPANPPTDDTTPMQTPPVSTTNPPQQVPSEGLSSDQLTVNPSSTTTTTTTTTNSGSPGRGDANVIQQK